MVKKKLASIVKGLSIPVLATSLFLTTGVGNPVEARRGDQNTFNIDMKTSYTTNEIATFSQEKKLKKERAVKDSILAKNATDSLKRYKVISGKGIKPDINVDMATVLPYNNAIDRLADTLRDNFDLNKRSELRDVDLLHNYARFGNPRDVKNFETWAKKGVTQVTNTPIYNSFSEALDENLELIDNAEPNSLGKELNDKFTPNYLIPMMAVKKYPNNTKITPEQLIQKYRVFDATIDLSSKDGIKVTNKNFFEFLSGLPFSEDQQSYIGSVKRKYEKYKEKNVLKFAGQVGDKLEELTKSAKIFQEAEMKRKLEEAKRIREKGFDHNQDYNLGSGGDGGGASIFPIDRDLDKKLDKLLVYGLKEGNFDLVSQGAAQLYLETLFDETLVSPAPIFAKNISQFTNVGADDLIRMKPKYRGKKDQIRSTDWNIGIEAMIDFFDGIERNYIKFPVEDDKPGFIDNLAEAAAVACSYNGGTKLKKKFLSVFSKDDFKLTGKALNDKIAEGAIATKTKENMFYILGMTAYSEIFREGNFYTYSKDFKPGREGVVFKQTGDVFAAVPGEVIDKTEKGITVKTGFDSKIIYTGIDTKDNDINVGDTVTYNTVLGKGNGSVGVSLRSAYSNSAQNVKVSILPMVKLSQKYWDKDPTSAKVHYARFGDISGMSEKIKNMEASNPESIDSAVTELNNVKYKPTVVHGKVLTEQNKFSFRGDLVNLYGIHTNDNKFINLISKEDVYDTSNIITAKVKDEFIGGTFKDYKLNDSTIIPIIGAKEIVEPTYTPTKNDIYSEKKGLPWGGIIGWSAAMLSLGGIAAAVYSNKKKKPNLAPQK